MHFPKDPRAQMDWDSMEEGRLQDKGLWVDALTCSRTQLDSEERIQIYQIDEELIEAIMLSASSEKQQPLKPNVYLLPPISTHS